MSSRRAVRTLAIAAITGLGITALATPARANDSNITVNGTWVDVNGNLGGGTISPDTFTGPSFTVTVDDTAQGLGATITVLPPSSGVVSIDGGQDCDGGGPQCSIEDGNGDPRTFFVDTNVTSLQGIQLWDIANGILLGSGGDTTKTFSVKWAATPTPTPTPDPEPQPTSAAAASTPGVHIQQFRMPTTGTCDEVAPQGLNWGGAASGGWGESWAQWANEGNGGDVCTRTLGYNTSTGTWQVQ